MKTQVFYSHGKLLLTGEYIVLDGALALATPTKKGQYLSVRPNKKPILNWKSYDEKNQLWFETQFKISLTESTKHSKEEQILLNILRTAKTLNPIFLNSTQGYTVTTHLSFDRVFGLGSSSTLINNIAKWAQINPFRLLQESFGGSGYDIACADSNNTLTYQLLRNKPQIHTINFNPIFSNHIYFIHLNKKQDSKSGIKHYRNLNSDGKLEAIKEINALTLQFITCNELHEFNELIYKHEHVISSLINIKTVHESLFSDYTQGNIKSLGAWGGDFIMVTTKTIDDLNYFKRKGYETIYSFQDMLL